MLLKAEGNKSLCLYFFTMNKTLSYIAVFCLTFLSSCSLFEGVFKAGYYVGIFVVIAILAIIFFIAAKIRS